jgi:phage terminase large subunit
MKTVKIGGVPNKKQAEFFASKAKFTAYGGARGGGKSWALRRKLVAICLRYKGATCLLVRRSYAELKSNHLSAFLTEYASIVEYREAEKTLFFPNGSRIILGYCASDRDMLRYQGQEYDVIAIDEATQMSEDRFQVFKACLRGVNPCPKRMYLTCNPGGIGHAWVKRLFVDREFREGENPKDYAFIRALVGDNVYLLEKDPEYKKQLEGLPQKLREAWLHGRWDVFEGQFFPEFDTARHVCAVSDIPKLHSYFLAFDYGFDMLAALVIGVSGEHAYVVREYCQAGLTLSEAAKRLVKEIYPYRMLYAVASPDLWNRRQDSGKSGVEIMQAVQGMPPMIMADNRRIQGWRVVREYLSGQNPRLHIAKTCTELIHSLSALLCDRVRNEDAASEPHAITHAPEALRYALMSRLPAEQKNAKNPFDGFFSPPKPDHNPLFD